MGEVWSPIRPRAAATLPGMPFQARTSAPPPAVSPGSERIAVTPSSPELRAEGMVRSLDILACHAVKLGDSQAALQPAVPDLPALVAA